MESLFDYQIIGDYIVINGFKEGQFVEDLVIPAQIGGYNVIMLAKKSFENLNIKNVSLPTSIVGIDYGSFNNCKKLEKVTSRKTEIKLPTLTNNKELDKWGIEYFGSHYSKVSVVNCFQNCDSLKYVDFSQTNICSVHDDFFNNSSVETIIFPENNFLNELYIQRYNFDGELNLPYLTKIVFPNLKIELKVRGSVFKDAFNLKEVELPYNALIFGEPFGSHTKLVNPEKIKDKSAYGKTTVNWFYQGVVEYVTDNHQISIEERAFEGHQTLKSVKITQVAFSNIGNYAFSNCPRLERIEVLKGAATFHGPVIEGSNNIKEIIVPDIGYLIKSKGLFNTKARIIIKNKSLHESATGNYSTKNILSLIVSGKLLNIYESINETEMFERYSHNTKDFVEIFKTAIDKDYIEIIETFAKNEKIHPKRINEYIEHAKSVGANRSLIFLSKWKNENVDLEKERKVEVAKTKKIMQDPDALLRQNFTFRVHKQYGLGIYLKDKQLLNEKNIDLPNKYKGKDIIYLPANIFNFSNLKEVDLPNKLLYIGDKAFYVCKNLNKINLPTDINIGRNAFSFSGLEEIIIENSRFGSIGSGAFKGTQIKEFEWPSTVDVIEEEMFADSRLEKIKIPNNVKSIGERVFGGTPIKDFKWPSTVDVIECYMFAGSKLERIKIPNNVKSIGSNAFERTQIKEFEWPSWIDKIGGGIFRDSQLEKINIPKNVKSIGFMAFSGTQIKTFEWPNTVDVIKEYIFCDSKLEKIKISNNVKSIGERAFKGTQIKEFEWPNTVDAIEVEMFADSKLEKIKISNNVKSIGERAFKGTQIKEFEWPSTVDGIQSFMFYDSTLEKVKIPNNVKRISNGAFYGTQIKEFEWPSTVDVIEEYMFAASALEKIKISNNVKSIGKRAFQECFKLKEIYIPKSVESFGDEMLKGCSIVVLYTEKDSKAHQFAKANNINYVLIKIA